jgi:class 3 adenylate cyclase
MFLSAAKVGVLSMQWDLMCPLCRGAKATAPTLDEVRKGVHCQTCNIDFEANFSQNVELTFTPHPQIRNISTPTYCIGGPMITPHIVVHQRLEPGETRSLSLHLTDSSYRVRTQKPGVEVYLELEAQTSTLCIKADVDTIKIRPVNQPSEVKNETGEIVLTLKNEAAYAQHIYLERSEWYINAVTAAQVTSLQHFRDLFSDEVLRPGEEIGIQGMTILFSDLVGSTAMYNQRGDAPSYALVREQFAFLQGIIRQHEGAIVKTIGDAIMGAFADPANGVRAALAIQQEISSFNADHSDTPLTIKLGLHHGPCIAVNLNGRLDYFGTTVNLASRLEGQSVGGDVIISDQIRQDPTVAKLLKATPVHLDPFKTTIKGFDEQFCLYRLAGAG